MESAEYEQVTGLLSQFDPFDVFEIGKHVKPEFVSETFTFRNVEFAVEIPFDMLEVVFGKGSKDEIPKSVTTPKGTEATLNGHVVLTLTTKFMVNDVEFVSMVYLSTYAINFLILEADPEGDDNVIKESVAGVSFHEPRIAQVRFWYLEDGSDITLFEGIGKGSVSIANFTKGGYSETGPCDVSSTEEAFDIAYRSSVYRLFRLISSYF